jgi:hypothetical protein
MSFIFYTIGDWGHDGDILKEIGNSMNYYSNIYKPIFVLALGDNFYPNGTKNIDDNLWNTTYQDIFTDKNLFCPWYPILGNHDYLGKVSSQLEYYNQKKDSRWIMRNKYYTYVYEFNDKKIQIIAIDTVIIGLETSRALIPDYLLINNNVNEREQQKHLEWLEMILKDSDANWKIVYGHYNLYSGGYHGNNNEMIDNLKSLFIKYKIDLYICGHCHDLEYIIDNNIHYIVSGSASKSGFVQNKNNTIFSSSRNGYTIHEIKDNKMFIRFIDKDKNIISENIIYEK